MNNKTVRCDFYIDAQNPSDEPLREYLTQKTPKIVEELFKLPEIIQGFNHNFTTLAFDIVLTDDEEIHQINLQYRKKDRPTDVITFSLFSDDEVKIIHDGTINLGEIIISTETAIRQAKEEGCSLEKEALTLLTHGLLHLLGFDHKDDAGYNFIVNIQNSIVKLF